jgi:hypothetical protein
VTITNGDGQTFGSWLLAQPNRSGPIGDLVMGAKADRQFPKYGTPDDVRKYLSKLRADGDTFEAVDDAEAGWMSARP